MSQLISGNNVICQFGVEVLVLSNLRTFHLQFSSLHGDRSNSSQQLPARFPGLNDYCSSLLDLTSTNPSIRYHLADSHQRICNSLSADSVYALEDLLADPVKLQKRLTTEVGESKASSLLAVSDSVYCSARLRSIAGKKARVCCSNRERPRYEHSGISRGVLFTFGFASF